MSFSEFQSLTDNLIWLEFDPNKEQSLVLLIVIYFIISLPIIGLLWTIFESKQIVFWQFSKDRKDLSKSEKSQFWMKGRIQLYILIISISFAGCVNECKDKISHDRKSDPFRMELLTQSRNLKFLHEGRSIELPSSEIIGIAMRRERDFSEPESDTQETKKLYTFEFYLVDRSLMEIPIFRSGKEINPYGLEAKKEFDQKMGKYLPFEIQPEIIEEEGIYFRPNYLNQISNQNVQSAPYENSLKETFEKSWQSDTSSNFTLVLMAISIFLLLLIGLESLLVDIDKDNEKINKQMIGIGLMFFLMGILFLLVYSKYETPGSHYIKITDKGLEYKKMVSGNTTFHRNILFQDIKDYSWNWKKDEIYLSTLKPKAIKAIQENSFRSRFLYDVSDFENKNLYFRWDKERESLLLLELYRFQMNRLEMIEIYRSLVEKIVRLQTKVDR
ncbi:MAG: hypothetical protein GW938_05265 [Leptospira sp.]|nr:hypothetical protein [Leptospira sp.]NCS95494.1 hypothetical protein [Leptospira sp.]